jgi:flagellar motor switch protein FliM
MTRTVAAPQLAPVLPSSADDGWDMGPRREGQVMADLPRAHEPAEADRPLPTKRGLLSPAEIEALLRPDLSDLPPEPAAVSARTVTEFAEPPAAMDADHELARRLAARLSLGLRDACGLPVAAMVSATTRGPFETALRRADGERGLAVVCFTQPGGDVGAMLVLSPGFTQLLIEAACGARERGGALKPLSPIDLALLEALVRPLAGALSPDLAFSGVETDALFAASIAPPAQALVTDLSMRVQGDTFAAQLITAGALASAPVAAERTVEAPRSSPAPGALSVTLTARIASLSVPLSKLSGLKPGATLLLGVPADQPVEIISGTEGGILAAEAQIGRRGGRVALRVTRRGPALTGLTRPTP